MITLRNKKLGDALTQLVSNPITDFWGEFALYINFEESKQIPTAAVTIRNHSMHFLYNDDYINSLTDKQVTFICLHEIFHLIRHHCSRGRICEKHRIANVAMDMLINDSIVEHYKTEAETPDGAYYTPVEYKGDKIFEPLYDWLVEKKEERDKQKQESEGEQNNDDPNGDSGDGDQSQDKYDKDGKDKNGNSKELNKILDSLDDYEFDVHLPSDVPDEVRNQIVNDIIEGIKRNRGTMGSAVCEILSKFQKHKKDYLRMIQRACDYIKGGKKKPTIKRISRRGVSGLKGRQKTGSIVNVVLDVSGSMTSEFDKVIGILFRDGYKLNLVQCDTQVTKSEIIENKNQLKNMKIKGLGGTVLQPGLDYIKENFPKYNTCLITDGYTDDLDFTGIKRSILVTSDAVPNVTGNVKIVKIQ